MMTGNIIKDNDSCSIVSDNSCLSIFPILTVLLAGVLANRWYCGNSANAALAGSRKHFDSNFFFAIVAAIFTANQGSPVHNSRTKDQASVFQGGMFKNSLRRWWGVGGTERDI